MTARTVATRAKRNQGLDKKVRERKSMILLLAAITLPEKQ
jgi:hypothetical protein